MIRTPNLEDRKSFGEISNKILFNLIGCDQKSLSFPDKNGSLALAFREKAIQITSSYSDLLRSDYILPFDRIEAIEINGTPRIERKSKKIQGPSMVLCALILGFLGLIIENDHLVLPSIMFTLGLILGALIPITTTQTSLFWHVEIHYRSESKSQVLKLEGKNQELKSFCSALKNHTLRDRVQDELNMIDVLSPDRTFGL